MENRNIFLIDKDKNYKRYSFEELHSFGLNKWKGWGCSAGLRNLYIDFDGNVWRAVCHEGGFIGNINATGLIKGTNLTDRCWIQCTRVACSCGADMAIPKVKNIDDKDKYFTPQCLSKDSIYETAVETVDPDVVYSRENDQFKFVSWDIGRLCNFDCHYCSKNSHNNFDPVKNLKFFLHAYENIKLWNFENERIKFSITGGEPTVYKDYLPFVKILKKDDHIIHTATNGSNTTKYYAELAEYSDIAFSIHLEYVKRLGLQKFLDNIKAAVETVERGYEEKSVARYNWIIAKIMLDPGNLETAKIVYDALKKEFSHYRNFFLVVDLLHIADDNGAGKVLHNYNEEEIKWMEELYKR